MPENHDLDQIKRDMAKRVYELRIKHEKSVSEIASRIRMSPTAYRKFEDGETLLRLHYAARLRDYWRARGEMIDLDFLVTGGIKM